mmetsp:Transcript_48826/g.104217  ORF Transcript_48826/g.104217 Transcript_48826/m.104217 type:complete len:331 (+) Transcript_48826:458-1450(+)
MIAVDPVHLDGSEQRRIDQRALDRHVRELVEAHEGAARGGVLSLGRAYDEQVLDAHAERASLVVARLIGEYHPVCEAHRVGVARRDGLRPFVHIQRGADPMSGAVQVVEPRPPERETGERVDRHAGRALREDARVEGDVPLEHAREHLALPRRRRAHVDRPRDISRAGLVLAARVEQQHLRAVDHRGHRRGERVVVDDRAVRAAAGDGREGEVHEARLRGAEARKRGGELGLAQLAALVADDAREPAKEVGERGAVDQMRLHHAAQLGVVLARLGQRDGRVAAHARRARRAEQRVVGLLRIKKELAAALTQLYHRRLRLFVRTDLHARRM